ncbi:unnamed protein product [Arabidopsis thaliana]|uniref:(thale cress) hypothetical protein n=1 Tax=Arabidopsis thaliana TaxID=3702 RepID=A0A7G2F2K8_ARATH|nr:unnamed protein product [Arabidopsis thaliana]
MADSSYSFVMKMTVKTTPASDLALTNLAYCSPFDLHRFAVPETADLFLANIPIKQLYLLMEMAAQRDGRSQEPVYIRKEKLDITHFMDCLQEFTQEI